MTDGLLLISLTEDEVIALRNALNRAICEGGAFLEEDREWMALLSRLGAPWDATSPTLPPREALPAADARSRHIIARFMDSRGIPGPNRLGEIAHEDCCKCARCR